MREKSADSVQTPCRLAIWRSLRRLREDLAPYGSSGCGPRQPLAATNCQGPWSQRGTLARSSFLNCNSVSQLNANFLLNFLASAIALLPRAISKFLRTASVPSSVGRVQWARIKVEKPLCRIHGKEAQLSEISTGQHSALALAIFLAQNSQLQSAPPVLLIDDPIAQEPTQNTPSL